MEVCTDGRARLHLSNGEIKLTFRHNVATDQAAANLLELRLLSPRRTKRNLLSDRGIGSSWDATTLNARSTQWFRKTSMGGGAARRPEAKWL